MESIWSTEQSPVSIIPKGTEVRFGYIWGYKDDKGMTPSAEITVTLLSDTSNWGAIELLEAKTKEYLAEHGCSYMRQYYIEGISKDERGLYVNLGT